MIQIRGTVDIQLNGGADPKLSDALRVLTQIREDATYGTYESLPKWWDEKLKRGVKKLAQVEPVQEKDRRGSNGFDFTLKLSEELFPAVSGGPQHLIGVLAGDLFSLNYRDYESVGFQIREVELQDNYRDELWHKFQGSDNNVTRIRELFKLKSLEPLLAHSVKPRIGIKPEKYKGILLKVLKAGFHIVEMDTRHVVYSELEYRELAKLAVAAAKVGARKGHITRFSPNISIASWQIRSIVDIFLDAYREADVPPPYVFKVDGGLEGLGACQALRTYLLEHTQFNNEDVVVTCYPLLRQSLGRYVPNDFFVELLNLCGADIIYPGGAPDVGGGARVLEGESYERGLSEKINRYDRLLKSKRFIPTVATAHPGQLHAFYECLGPDVAYFLGGAVALHKGGPTPGAKLCVKVLKEAVKKRKRSRGKNVGALPSSVLAKIVDGYRYLARNKDGDYDDRWDYINPGGLFGDLHDKVEPYFVRVANH